jgi:hypothetical protein
MPDTALTPDQICHLLRECVTVVGPGETLVLRFAPDVPVSRLAEYQIVLNAAHEHDGWPKVVVVAADELAVATGAVSLPERVRQMATKADHRG